VLKRCRPTTRASGSWIAFSENSNFFWASRGEFRLAAEESIECNGSRFAGGAGRLERFPTSVLNAIGDQINTDPILGPLQDNGGPTFTHALLTGSPAINAGDPKGD
jgi:hypothetical protein